MRQTLVLRFGADAIARAARLIGEGEPVAVATETVYGLAADATDSTAVARIYAAKGRPSFNPLIVHVADLEQAERLGVFDAEARALARAHWPGPLTLVVPARPGNGIASLATAGLASIALRVPAHRAIRALIEATGRPLAAPSANASGRISPTRADHVLATLDGRIALVIDDGPCPVGIESTIVAATGGPLRLLRSGPVTIDALPVGGQDRVEAPGQSVSHYAPAKPLRLDATARGDDEWLIGFGAVAGDATLSASGDTVEAAARLFDALHVADRSDRARIAVAPVTGNALAGGPLADAINDRLRRAAH